MTRRAAILRLASAFAWPLPAHNARLECRYRADAVITLLSMPVYSRRGVGSGYALLAQISASSTRVHSIGFAGGSWPERAKGFNRLGLIQEHVVENDSAVHEARYFGFMTSSPEESIGEVKRASDGQRQGIPISAILGSINSGRYRSRLTHLNVAPSMNWGNVRDFLPLVRQAFTRGAPRCRSVEIPANASAQPFLFTLARAIRSSQLRGQYDFVYGGQLHTLLTGRETDEASGERMRTLGLTCEPREVYRLTGTIRNTATRRQTKFKLWFDASAGPMPLRVELQPRSFLRLIFEADPSLPRFEFPTAPDGPETI